MSQSQFLAVSAVLSALMGLSLPATAQQQPAPQRNQQWFIPNQARPAAPRPAPRAMPAPTDQPQAESALGPDGGAGEAPQQQVQVQLPPPPEVAPLPKGATPPAAILGVLSLPDVMHASTAYLEADKEFIARRQKLNEDAQKEQVALRDLGQQLSNERTKLTPEQIRTREKELQDRITTSRRVFGERNRIIQESSQYVLAQIDRATEMVTQQVAISRGINIVLNRAQVLGSTAEFDMTPAVVEDLNKVLAKVVIPPDGVSPVDLNKPADNAAPSQDKTSAVKPAPAKPATATASTPATTPPPGTPQKR